MIDIQSFKTILTGEIQGGDTAFQLPNIPCALVKFKAERSNSNNVYIGVSGVTKPDGVTDTTTGFELDAGEETDWLPVENLNKFYAICDGNGDDIVYMALL
jgi:hypothetical protein